jgi:cytochrome c peroxidase
MPVPEDNPLLPARVALGRALFFDRRLSADESLACATCHNPERAFADRRRVSVGISGAMGHRNAPTLVNRGFGASHFWDGRASGLEAQVLEPIQNPTELGGPLEAAVSRLDRDTAYRDAFLTAFGGPVTSAHVARALASYVRTILAGDAPMDRFLAGDHDALTPAARAGLDVFRSRANCTACHLGPTFTDEQFHNTGVAWRDGRLLDEGRASVTGRDRDRGAFKTPTLREIARTAPYMHDGSLATLDNVIDFYDRGGTPNPSLDPEIRPLKLTPFEKRALVAFLQSLSGIVCEGGEIVVAQ